MGRGTINYVLKDGFKDITDCVNAWIVSIRWQFWLKAVKYLLWSISANPGKEVNFNLTLGDKFWENF